MAHLTPLVIFVNLLFGGIYAGFLVSVLVIELTLRRFEAPVYVQGEQVKHARLNALAAGCLTLIFATGLLWLLAAPHRRTVVPLLGMLLCFACALGITLRVNVPINAAQMRRRRRPRATGGRSGTGGKSRTPCARRAPSSASASAWSWRCRPSPAERA